MIRVGFSGIPCTGKTSTARAFALAAKGVMNIDNIELVSEYARTYLSKHNSIDEVWEQYRIINKQIEWENALPDSVELMITDSPLPLAFLYACDLHKPNNSKENMVLSDIFQVILADSTTRPYDIIFHFLPGVIPVESDGIRPIEHLDTKWRTEADEFVRSSYRQFKPSHFVVVDAVTIEDRVAYCINKLREVFGGDMAN